MTVNENWIIRSSVPTGRTRAAYRTRRVTALRIGRLAAVTRMVNTNSDSVYSRDSE
jgi:hypothetical protein